jgi:glyoxylase-like metal-dependent hydrolase (beta-lactamase superfamily II)
LIVQTLPVGALETNCYFAYCPDTKEAIIVDPAGEPERILAEVQRLALKPLFIVNTHGHIDHVAANDAVRKAVGAPLLIHAGDASYLERPDPTFARWLGAPDRLLPADRNVGDGDTLAFGACLLTVLHTPGHTPGGISLYGEGVVFTGDALFNQGVGRTDLPGGNWRQLQTSIRTRLFTLPDDTIVYPGHGPETTIGSERAENPYV